MDNYEKKLPELDPENLNRNTMPVHGGISAASGNNSAKPANSSEPSETAKPAEPAELTEFARFAEAQFADAAPETQGGEYAPEVPNSEKNILVEKMSGTEQSEPAGTEEDGSSEAAGMTDSEVMRHTASLWRYRSVSDDGTEQHDESHCKRLKAGRCEVIGARVRGKKHKHEGTNCDDWFETARTDDCVIAVVADGAGSKQLSRIGARVSCDSAAGYLKRELPALFSGDPDLKKRLSGEIGGEPFMNACGKFAALIRGAAAEAFNAVILQLKQVYSDKTYISSLGRNPTLSDMGCTFLAAVAVPLEINGEHQNFVITVQIGDGCIAAIDSAAAHDSCFKLLGEADSGAYSGETDFLSEKNVSEGVIGRKIRISRGKSDIIMLMSDGVADDYFPAQPMMKRLYLDLCLNGILPMKGECGKALPPEPVKFPSVSPEQRTVAVQYAKQLLRDNSEEAVNELWDARSDLKPHSLEAWGCSLGETPERRLVSWLDNYNERGSFDDRTLVVLDLNAE